MPCKDYFYLELIAIHIFMQKPIVSLSEDRYSGKGIYASVHIILYEIKILKNKKAS